MYLIYGVGYNDGKYPTKINSKRLHEYAVWRGVIYRCYNEKHHIRNKSYAECSVSENFKSYSYFYEWYQENNPRSDKSLCLDKDLLVKENKIYGENTCVFLPSEINGTIHPKKSCRGNFPIGVYWASKANKFASCVRFSGRNITLGYYDDEYSAFLAYKKAKEHRIKLLAEKYKGVILPKAYDALMNYTVEITD